MLSATFQGKLSLDAARKAISLVDSKVIFILVSISVEKTVSTGASDYWFEAFCSDFSSVCCFWLFFCYNLAGFGNQGKVWITSRVQEAFCSWATGSQWPFDCYQGDQFTSPLPVMSYHFLGFISVSKLKVVFLTSESVWLSTFIAAVSNVG